MVVTYILKRIKKCIYSSVVPISGIIDGWQMFDLDDVKSDSGE